VLPRACSSWTTAAPLDALATEPSNPLSALASEVQSCSLFPRLSRISFDPLPGLDSKSERIVVDSEALIVHGVSVFLFYANAAGICTNRGNWARSNTVMRGDRRARANSSSV
jgi:hypothetical protein